MNAQIAQELAMRHQVSVLTSQGLGLPAESIDAGVKIYRVPVYFRKREATASILSMLAFIPNAIQAGRRLLRKEHFDVINTHFVLPSGPVGDALAREAGIPNVLTVHGGDLYDPSKFSSPHRHPLLRVWVRLLLRRADVVVGQSENTLQNMQKYYTPEIRGLRIPLGINRSVCYTWDRKEYGFGSDDILLISVGRLVARKAVEQLIAMLSEISDPRVRLVLVGSGPEESSLRREVSLRGLASRVRFMGYVDDCDKFKLLSMSDIYVSTSQHEGFCLSYLEAMTSGLPVVCYDYGGHTDYLQNLETGFVVPLNRLDLFTKRTLALMEHPELRRKIGEKNRRRAEDFYVDTCAAKYETVFNSAIEGLARQNSLQMLRAPKTSLD